MFDERAFIAAVEGADAERFAQILRRPSPEEERALRVHFGDARYERLHALATAPSATRGMRAARGNVVVLHGIMGGELTVYPPGQREQHIWMNIPRLIIGAVGWLPMNRDGSSANDVRATGILKKYYGEIILRLSQEWNVRTFWFDWRKDLRLLAGDLNRSVNSWFGSNTPVHFVAHSMGGLVVRSFAQAFDQRWKAAWDRPGKGKTGGRLVMLGTPNHGSFAIPQVITGAKPIVRKLAAVDLKHKLPDLLAVLNSFPGSYQMLPSPLIMSSMAPLYKAATYGSSNPSQQLLDNALQHHQRLASVVDGGRMLYVAGANQATHVDIADFGRINSLEGYRSSLAGDGTVPHLLGFLKDKSGNRIPTFFVNCEHGTLPADDRVITASSELMASGTCSLPQQVPTKVRGVAAVEASEAALRLENAQSTADEMHLRALAERLQPRARGLEAGAAPLLSSDEREAEEILLSDFLRADSRGSTPEVAQEILPPRITTKGQETTAVEASAERKPTDRLVITLLQGGIEKVDALVGSGAPVDVIAVGHYVGVKPQAAELALDRAISEALPGRLLPKGETTKRELQDLDLLITQYTERGIVRGELGQPFLIPDPRRPGRTVALAGMGVPGRFGVPELTVLAQELCWAVGRMGKRHLATVLIGAGAGNLNVPDAIGAWMRGLRRAITASVGDERRHLTRLTFVEFDPRQVVLIDAALQAEQKRLGETLAVDYQPFTKEQLEKLSQEGFARSREELEKEWENRRKGLVPGNDQIPVRLSVAADRKAYQFAAITESAAIPQREVAVDPRLIAEANNDLAAASRPVDQLECGRLLERLLIPEDVRGSIYTSAPLVLTLDTTTARIHWEMMAQSDHRLLPTETQGGGQNTEPPLDPSWFLGTSRGLTRQLRTTFAPPPEPPPPARRMLRVLVVADPADDAPLPGAQAEGEEVAALFESFNTVYRSVGTNTVEVVRLFGPYQATRTHVLRHIMFTNFHVLHFAGHCVYDTADPENSGWIFSRGERLTARELNRVDRVPKFIFSNACESGITPDRSELRSAALAPTFAEAFFARGVANFVCTAWPVNDTMAQLFARRLYSGLLGLIEVGKPEPMHAAMREARLKIATEPDGNRTWGAYQHYGNPYFRLFDSVTILGAQSPSPSAPKTAARKQKSRTKTATRKRRATATKHKPAKKTG